MGQLIIYTDGGAKGNPGPGAAAAVFYNEKGQRIKEVSKFLGVTTNNQAEYQAVILALEEAEKLGFKKVKIFLDSELIVNQLNNLYRVKDAKLKSLYFRILKLSRIFHSLSWAHIPRTKNKLADRLVRQEIKKHLITVT